MNKTYRAVPRVFMFTCSELSQARSAIISLLVPDCMSSRHRASKDGPWSVK
jgi:hypothetical protein